MYLNFNFIPSLGYAILLSIVGWTRKKEQEGSTMVGLNENCSYKRVEIFILIYSFAIHNFKLIMMEIKWKGSSDVSSIYILGSWWDVASVSSKYNFYSFIA